MPGPLPSAAAGAQIDTGDAETMARGFLDDKIKLTWNMQRVLLPAARRPGFTKPGGAYWAAYS